MTELLILLLPVAYLLGFLAGKRTLLRQQQKDKEQNIRMLAAVFNLTPKPGEGLEAFEQRLQR
jgi:lipopolysaccharide biosynthesis regulator YciM